MRIGTHPISRYGTLWVHGFFMTPQNRADLIALLVSLTDEDVTRDPKFADPWTKGDRPGGLSYNEFKYAMTSDISCAVKRGQAIFLAVMDSSIRGPWSQSAATMLMAP